MPGAPWLVWAGLQKPCREQTSHAQEQDSYWAYPGTPLFRPPEFLDWFIMFYLSQHPPQHSTSTSTRKPLVWPYDRMTFTSQPEDPKGIWPRSCHPWSPKWLQPFWIWRPPLRWRHDGDMMEQGRGQDLTKFQSGCEQGKLWMKPMSTSGQ